MTGKQNSTWMIAHEHQASITDKVVELCGLEN